jgi:hypothetical protein
MPGVGGRLQRYKKNLSNEKVPGRLLNAMMAVTADSCPTHGNEYDLGAGGTAAKNKNKIHCPSSQRSSIRRR